MLKIIKVNPKTIDDQMSVFLRFRLSSLKKSTVFIMPLSSIIVHENAFEIWLTQGEVQDQLLIQPTQ